MASVNLKDMVYETLRDRIVYLEYKPGAVLEEKPLCQEFGVSRTPLREALLRLKEQGLVSIYPRSGSYVAQIDILELRNLFVVKQNLDGLSAELAATRIPAADLERLSETLRLIESASKASDFRKLVMIDTEFHEILHNATMNEPLKSLLEIMRYRCRRGWYYYMELFPELQSPVVDNLTQVLEALGRRDPAAARVAMETHTAAFIAIFNKVLG